jgi:hypothetical protein
MPGAKGLRIQLKVRLIGPANSRSSQGMLAQLCFRISATIHSVLSVETTIMDNAVCDPVAYFGSIHRLQMGVLGIVAGPGLSSHSLFERNVTHCNTREKEGLEAFGLWFREQELGKVNLSDLYEMMLLLEFPVRDGAVIQHAENLNSIGSFYTPNELADRIVELTLNDHILRNTGIDRFSTCSPSKDQIQVVKQLLEQASFADLSCGTGSFFLAILRYCEVHLWADKEWVCNIAMNFHAIEADALSLEIAKLRVLEAIGEPDLYEELSRKFLQGNPLIAPNRDYPTYDFGPRFYYHNGLALGPNELPTCDVVLGNPPWGTVDFDLGEYLHLLCPNLAEIEDETELDKALERVEGTHPRLYDWLLNLDDAADLAVEDIYNDGRFEHSTSGGLQTNVLFTELCDGFCSANGTVGLLLKGSTLADPRNKRLWNHLFDRGRVSARFDLNNSNRIFNIERTEEFSVLILGSATGKGTVHRKALSLVSELT